jgi:hypothetical protein
MDRYSHRNGGIGMNYLHFKHVLFWNHTRGRKKREFALNKQVNLERIVLLGAGFRLLYTQVQRLALGFTLVQSPNKKKL